MIAAGDGVQNAASIERMDDFPNTVAQTHIIALKQSPAPQCVVQVPHDALDFAALSGGHCFA